MFLVTVSKLQNYIRKLVPKLCPCHKHNIVKTAGLFSMNHPTNFQESSKCSMCLTITTLDKQLLLFSSIWCVIIITPIIHNKHTASLTTVCFDSSIPRITPLSDDIIFTTCWTTICIIGRVAFSIGTGITGRLATICISVTLSGLRTARGVSTFLAPVFIRIWSARWTLGCIVRVAATCASVLIGVRPVQWAHACVVRVAAIHAAVVVAKGSIVAIRGVVTIRVAGRSAARDTIGRHGPLEGARSGAWSACGGHWRHYAHNNDDDDTENNPGKRWTIRNGVPFVSRCQVAFLWGSSTNHCN